MAFFVVLRPPRASPNVGGKDVWACRCLGIALLVVKSYSLTPLHNCGMNLPHSGCWLCRSL